MLTCTRFLAVASFVAVFAACSGEGSTDSKTDGFSADVADKAEPETYEQENLSSSFAESSSSEKEDGAEISSSSEKENNLNVSSSSETNGISSSGIMVLYSSSDESSAYSDSSVYDAENNTLVDFRDGKMYKTVTIGDQIWMAANLNYADSAKTVSIMGRSFCYNNVAKNCDETGRLYYWAVAMGCATNSWITDGRNCGFSLTNTPDGPVRGLCPSDWHIPRREEWETLITSVGGMETAGKVLKSTSGWRNGGNGTDDYSFSAFPAGSRNTFRDSFDGDDSHVFFWSSTEDSNEYASAIYLYYYDDAVHFDSYDKSQGLSVRCVKD